MPLSKQNQNVKNNEKYTFMSALERLNSLIDEGTFVGFDENLYSKNILDFPNYSQQLQHDEEQTKLNEGIISGLAKISGIDVSIAVFEFNFMAGTMGMVIGEIVARTFERAIEKNIPAIIVTLSGGARVQEGLFSLMQMAKTNAVLKKLKDKGLPFIAVPLNPTTGGVTASFVMMADIIISEPKAKIGFAGTRVVEQTLKEKVPNNFQSSESLLDAGMIDIICEKENLKETLAKVLYYLV